MNRTEAALYELANALMHDTGMHGNMRVQLGHEVFDMLHEHLSKRAVKTLLRPTSMVPGTDIVLAGCAMHVRVSRWDSKL